ncbi:MAG: hypothetical protein M1817_000487 [Caeruleum heppii]|nr:MAG: hypothetical protein M1817_000487 [Caeruleum heppii]
MAEASTRAVEPSPSSSHPARPSDESDERHDRDERTPSHSPHDTDQPPLTSADEPPSTAPPLPSEAVPPLPSEGVPPLPTEDVPPLPSEPLPSTTTDPASEADDGWEPFWHASAQTYYFFNRHTGETTWTNPRVPEGDPAVSGAAGGGTGGHDRIEAGDGDEGEVSEDHDDAPTESRKRKRPHGGYDPRIHGDYDPNAEYAQLSRRSSSPSSSALPPDPSSTTNTTNPAPADYTSTGTFNRFTSRFQAPTITPSLYSDDQKSHNQMAAFFDVDAAANSHEGRSLKKERQMQRLSKKEVKAFKEEKRRRKEERKRAWLRD